jgi:hypothetical protein
MLKSLAERQGFFALQSSNILLEEVFLLIGSHHSPIVFCLISDTQPPKPLPETLSRLKSQISRLKKSENQQSELGEKLYISKEGFAEVYLINETSKKVGRVRPLADLIT